MGALVHPAIARPGAANELAINPIIYSELSLMYESIEALEQTVATMRLSLS